MKVFPKFIIETDEQKGDCLIIARCTHHKQLATDISRIKGGGWWTFERQISTLTFYGESHEFGRAMIQDIVSCFQRKKVFSHSSLHPNFTDNLKFQYQDESGKIFELETCIENEVNLNYT